MENFNENKPEMDEKAKKYSKNLQKNLQKKWLGI